MSASPRRAANADARRGGTAHLQFRLEERHRRGAPRRQAERGLARRQRHARRCTSPTIKAHETRKLTVDLKVGKHISLGRHKVKVELSVGGHTLTQTATVVVSR